MVVKVTSYDARLEAEGLTALASAGAATPGVLHVEERLLVLQYVRGPADWVGLATRLAAGHRQTDPTTGRRFGWHRDNVLGPTPQANAPTDDWPSFFVEHRLLRWIDDVPTDVARRLDRAAAGPALDLLDHDVQPSLLHGDLWSGNVVDGRWLIDPAVHHGDRELDLAMADLFGGFPTEFWAAYREAWPLDPGWERRRSALALHYQLAHVHLFGNGYLPGVVTRLDQLGW